MVSVTLLLSASVAALAALGYLQESPPPAADRRLLPTLGRWLSGAPVAIVVALLLVVTLSWSLRRVTLEWRVWSPGPILVHDLSVGDGIDGVDGARLTATFRARLMKARLRSPAAVPGATPAQDFLEMLENAEAQAGSLFSRLLGMLKVAVPTHGYEVRVDLVRRPVDGRNDRWELGAMASLTRLPAESIPVVACWATSWEEAVERAADEVTAVVLPRTRVTRAGPWAGWRRFEMPAGLLPAYECAQVHTAARRYDEALSCYYRALELDPKNVAIRLNIGFVQEKLGLALDAAATYLAARQVAERTDSRLYGRRARRERRALRLNANYRLAILLAGRRFAHQWRHAMPPGEATERDTHREALRARLRDQLLPLLAQVPALKPLTGAERGGRSLLAEILARRARSSQPDDEPGFFELRQLLARLAEQLLQDVRARLRHRRNTIATSPTPLTVSLAVELVTMRARWVESRLGRPPADAYGRRSSAWKPAPKQALDVACGLRGPEALRTWAEHYNAACLYAVPLLDEALDQASAAQFTVAAARHLEKAVSSSFSGEVAERRAWLVSEDPDLDGLRRRDDFRCFEAVYFPLATRTLARRGDLHDWEMSCYTHELLLAAAVRWQQVWHVRARSGAPSMDLASVRDWFSDERRAWDLIDLVARHHRHWPVRYRLIEEMQALAAKYRFARLEVALLTSRDYADRDGSAPAPSGGPDTLAGLIEANDRRLEALHRRLGLTQDHQLPAETALGPLIERWNADLDDRYAEDRELDRARAVALCTAQAALWQRLADWVVQPPAAAAPAAGRFGVALDHAVGLWVRSGGAAAPPVVAPVAQYA